MKDCEWKAFLVHINIYSAEQLIPMLNKIGNQRFKDYLLRKEQQAKDDFNRSINSHMFESVKALKMNQQADWSENMKCNSFYFYLICQL